jgi:hypothetical protein
LLKAGQAVKQAEVMMEYRAAEREELDKLRRYYKGVQSLPAVIPAAAPREVRVMARIARVNIIAIVVDSLTQSTYVEGFRAAKQANNLDVWDVWQANRWDARQSGVHRATFTYGAGYAVVLPGNPKPVMRGVSPRNLTALYGEDPDWPIWALEDRRNGLWSLYDDEAIYFLSAKKDDGFEFIDARPHGIGVTPVVRYLDDVDLDADDDVEPERSDGRDDGGDKPMRGQVAPLRSIQDQIDLTTFGLLVAQWYSAFRQRWAIGWVSPDEKRLMDRLLEGNTEDPEATARAAAAAKQAATMKAGASQLWTFDADPQEMQLGEFDQTSLDGFLKSRESSIRHAASLSQTPAHELIGELVNLSAEALAAADASRDRKVDSIETSLGESHEQTMWIVGKLTGIEVPADAQVVWRDTSARSFAATVDALGKLTKMLDIPPQELWERVPGATQQDIERWKAAAQEGDSFRVLADMLERQGAPTGA